jgi:hypothetical protein
MGKINPIAITMLSVCSLLRLAKANIRVDPFKQSTGIYFERLGKLEVVAMEWTLVIQYNMSTYWNEIENVELAHKELQALCKELPRLNCNILNQLKWQLRNLMADNELLLASNKGRTRVRRSLGDTMGVILGDMFGILTQREASEYEDRFERINNNEHHLLTLVKNQTTLIDNTVKLVKHNTNLTLTSINNLIREQNHLRQEMSELQEYQSYEDRVRSIMLSILELSLILRNLEETQQALLDVTYDAHRGIIHPAILTPTQLSRELHLIQQHVPASITIPGHNLRDLTHVYQSMKTQSRVTQQSIIIKLTLPLAFTWDYTLLAVIPVPDINHGTTQSHIISTAEYLAVDKRREHFATLTKEDVSRCQVFQPTQFLCKLSPILTAITDQGNCEIALLQRREEINTVCSSRAINGTNHWIKLHTPNQWIYVIPNETTVDVICESTIQPYKFQGSGLVEIGPGCMLRDAESLIIATARAHSNISMAFHNSNGLLHEGNHLREFHARIINKTIAHQQIQLMTAPTTRELEKQITTLEQNEFLAPNQSIHHVHHYTMIHIVFWSGILIAVTWGARRLYSRKSSASHRPPSPLPTLEGSAA